MLTICMFCRHVRQMYGTWQEAEDTDRQKMRLEPVSHGICPSCARKHYGYIVDK
jgi:hypothetical protein